MLHAGNIFTVTAQGMRLDFAASHFFIGFQQNLLVALVTPNMCSWEVLHIVLSEND